MIAVDNEIAKITFFWSKLYSILFFNRVMTTMTKPWFGHGGHDPVEKKDGV